MRSPSVVETHVAIDLRLGVNRRLAGVKKPLFVFVALPQSLDEHVVLPCPLAVRRELAAKRCWFGALVNAILRGQFCEYAMCIVARKP